MTVRTVDCVERNGRDGGQRIGSRREEWYVESARGGALKTLGLRDGVRDGRGGLSVEIETPLPEIPTAATSGIRGVPITMNPRVRNLFDLKRLTAYKRPSPLILINGLAEQSESWFANRRQL